MVSVPVSMAAGLGNAARNGVLVRGGGIRNRVGGGDIAVGSCRMLEKGHNAEQVEVMHRVCSRRCPARGTVVLTLRSKRRLVTMVNAQTRARVVSVHVGPAQRFDEPDTGRSWVSAIDKAALTGPVWVGRENITGDEQADRRHHGGPDKAVFVYPAEHYPAWRAELALPSVGPGAFGENLAVADLTEDDVCLGDVWDVGAVRLQVSQPRRPCWKPARRWGVADLVPRIHASGRTGWYLRVLAEGSLRAGDAMVLRDRPYPQWPLSLVNHTMRAPGSDPATTRELAQCPALPDRWRQEITRSGR